jgi:short-subunit dehydrogenase
LVIAARRLDRLETLRAELVRRHHVRVIVAGLDVTDASDVQSVFDNAVAELGSIDRVVVNAGLGKGTRVGHGGLSKNRETLETNVIGALTQCEVSMDRFYKQGHGHLVVMSSASAVRGQPGAMTAYAASKAAVAAIAEGIRADLLRRRQGDIRVTTLFPGKIASEMTERAGMSAGVTDTETGCRALASAINAEVSSATVPWWPWAPLTLGLRYLPLRYVNRYFT